MDAPIIYLCIFLDVSYTFLFHILTHSFHLNSSFNSLVFTPSPIYVQKAILFPLIPFVHHVREGKFFKTVPLVFLVALLCICSILKLFALKTVSHSQYYINYSTVFPKPYVQFFIFKSHTHTNKTIYVLILLPPRLPPTRLRIKEESAHRTSI